VAALACLAGCAAGTSAQLADGPPADPAGLVGVWQLAADGEPEEAILQLGGPVLTVMRRCVSLSGTWAARGGLFLADMPDGPDRVRTHRSCPEDVDVPVPGWLTQAAAYARDGDGWRLLDRGGDEVATLRPGSYPGSAGGIVAVVDESSGPGGRPGWAEHARLAAAPAEPLPADVRPATAAELAGRWEPDLGEVPCDRPYLDLRPDGTWAGHGDADDFTGRWVLGAAGLALGTASEPGGGCAVGEEDPDLAPGATAVDAWMLRLARAGLRGDHLVLLDPYGAQLAELTRRQQ
jgi:hypothetical protein